MTAPQKVTFDQRKMLSWLRDTAAGQHFLDGMKESQCLNCERLRDQAVKCTECDSQQRVLVVCGVTPEGKAWLEVYGDEKVSVRVQQQLTTCPAGEIDASGILETKLPWGFSEVYLPVNLKTTHTLLPRTPADEMAVQSELAFLKELRKFPS